MEYEIRGIVLHKQDINEFDEIITIISDNGKVTFFAPGVKKVTSKNRSALLPLCLSNFEIIDNEKNDLLPRLKRATLIKSIPWNTQLQQEYKDLVFFFKKIEKADCITLLNDYQEVIDDLSNNKNKVIDYILNSLLGILGIKPRYDRCVECNNTQNIVNFEFHKGGYLCALHSPNNNLERHILNALYWMNKNYWAFVEECSSNDAFYIRKMIIQYLLETT
ncbi:DNA repair protein RecO [Metamycoplasma neophronis]|uniref:DNA repair protein RecO n=1 Tax=Metamycoplasma neophronis TaxID=872983 RepID=A0ABY2Z126_9BACT|nr:DNA repair protein RecO [Metamycoplasma neophronis]TPR54672.1 DNA repair protein RecO [Metamycoplasma neophronis]